MKNITNINVIRIISSNIDHDDGRLVYDAIQTALQAGSDIQIDLHGLDIVTPSFLNTSFRVLAKQYSYDLLKGRLKIVNSTPLINRMIRDALTGQN